MRRQMFLRKLVDGTHHPLNTCLMRILAVFCICLVSSSYAITCHCLNNAQCNQADGGCPNGCAQGWHGPGCQIGNVALGKPAGQSTTNGVYTADKAVDGAWPEQGSYSGRICSHTVQSQSNEPHWWYVNLSESEDFVVIDITIVKTPDIRDVSLNNFYILYTSEITGFPNLTTWKHCTHQPKIQRGINATYRCNSGTAIGRRVAIYLATTAPRSPTTDTEQAHQQRSPTTNRRLILCEAIVNGYAYQETSMLRHNNITVTSNCNNITVMLGVLPIVPPTFLIVHMNASNGPQGSRVERIRNVGAPFVTLLAMANVTYKISLAPETCCIGLMCLNDQAASIERSRCIVGPSTNPLSTETPQYQRYSLHKFEHSVKVIRLGSSQCQSANISIRCQGVENKESLSQCSNEMPCTLDPRHNHTCILRVTYGDGFVDSSTSNITIGTADFSQINLTAKTTCNTATLSMENLTKKWDLNPSSIFFTINSSQGNETKAKQIVARETQGDYKETFDVVQNTNYAVWAFPETCWTTKKCSSLRPEVCNTFKECFNGTSTIIKTVKTVPREYYFQVHECCLSLTSLSPPLCEAPSKTLIVCWSNDFTVNASSTEKTPTLCDLKAGRAYTCSMELHLTNGKLEHSNFYFENENVSECKQPEKSSPSSLSVPLVVGAVAGGLALLILIAVSVGIFRQRAQATKGHSTAENHQTANDTECGVEERTYASLNQDSRLHDENIYSSLRIIA